MNLKPALPCSYESGLHEVQRRLKRGEDYFHFQTEPFVGKYSVTAISKDEEASEGEEEEEEKGGVCVFVCVRE